MAPVALTQAEVEAWGERLGRTAARPLWICLRGPLGAGKSTLARAIGRGAGVEQAMPSPSYNLVLRYPAGSGWVVHADLYRMATPDELVELGWDDLGDGDELVLVEWSERAGGRLPPSYWEVELHPDAEFRDRRRVTVRAVGNPGSIPAPPE